MSEAAIVSTARTPIGKAYRGSYNNTHGADLMGHAIEHSIKRSGADLILTYHACDAAAWLK